MGFKWGVGVGLKHGGRWWDERGCLSYAKLNAIVWGIFGVRHKKSPNFCQTGGFCYFRDYAYFLFKASSKSRKADESLSMTLSKIKAYSWIG